MVPGGTYTLKLEDGQTGQLRIDTLARDDSNKFQAVFVGEGAPGYLSGCLTNPRERPVAPIFKHRAVKQQVGVVSKRTLNQSSRLAPRIRRAKSRRGNQLHGVLEISVDIARVADIGGELGVYRAPGRMCRGHRFGDRHGHADRGRILGPGRLCCVQMNARLGDKRRQFLTRYVEHALDGRIHLSMDRLSSST